MTGDKWAQEAGVGEREKEKEWANKRVRESVREWVRAYIYIPIAEFLREQFVFIGLSKGVGDEEGIKILDGNEPPEVISFRLLFYYPSHENSYFFYVMLISFSVRHCSRGQMRVFLYIRSAKW